MNYIIFDLEWNQSGGSTKVDENGNHLPFEIVEIGAVKLNENRDMIGEFSELIKPQIYQEMHYITSKLIHLQMEQLEKGKPFVEVMERFLEWCGDDVIFCTWGPLDLLELQRNMRYYNMPPLTDRPLKFFMQAIFCILLPKPPGVIFISPGGILYLFYSNTGTTPPSYSLLI